MKIEINLYDETGERVVGKAIETDCQSLIINGMHIIQGGGVHAEMRQLSEAVGNMQHGDGVIVGEQLTPSELRYNANLNLEDMN
tara:strand:- start:350 stop:601 length:252 start_codon:yes stop_codon:yes gene_type:complete